MHRLFSIENKILIPFLLIGVLTISCFGIISVYSGYNLKMDNEIYFAESIVNYISHDMKYIDEDSIDGFLKDKYGKNKNLQITNSNSVSIIKSPLYDKALADSNPILKQSNDNLYGYEIIYTLDRSSFYNELFEDQKYIIMAAISFLIIISQSSIFIAYNISEPISKLGKICYEIDSSNYDVASIKILNRHDEIGQLSITLSNMLQNINRSTQERIKMEKQILQNEKLALTGQVASALAHEIKNPLAGIRAGIQVVSRRSSAQNDKLLCKSMIQEVDRVNTLIGDLLTLSIKKEHMPERVNISAILNEIGQLYSAVASKKGFEFEIKLEDEIEILACGDEIRQVLHNLINNSIKAFALKDEVGIITIQTFCQGKKGVIKISDNGCGMTDEELKMSIEPFYSGNINGTGLGLPIVKNIVEKNHGEIFIDSSPFVGTDILIKFDILYEDGGYDTKDNDYR